MSGQSSKSLANLKLGREKRAGLLQKKRLTNQNNDLDHIQQQIQNAYNNGYKQGQTDQKKGSNRVINNLKSKIELLEKQILEKDFKLSRLNNDIQNLNTLPCIMEKCSNMLSEESDYYFMRYNNKYVYSYKVFF